jgi:hypothetical protein
MDRGATSTLLKRLLIAVFGVAVSLAAHAVAATVVPPTVIEGLASGTPQEVLVVLRDDPIRQQAPALRSQANATRDDAGILSFKGAALGLKDRLLASPTPDARFVYVAAGAPVAWGASAEGSPASFASRASTRRKTSTRFGCSGRVAGENLL